jgi:hypothetical protein
VCCDRDFALCRGAAAAVVSAAAVPGVAMASKSKAAPAIKPLDRPLIEGSLTKLAFVGNLGRVRELLDPPDGKSAADVAEKDA